MVDGGFAYKCLFIAQHSDIYDVFTELISLIKPKRVLEIGTMHGGLTLMIRDILDSINLSTSIIRTYDINNQEFLKPLVINKQVEVFTQNLFNNNYSDWLNEISKQEIYNYIQQDGTSMVLCDGGCKKCEVNLINSLLKNQDIIMAHDYAPNENYFNKFIKGKIWDWMEIQDSDIDDPDSLISYHQQLCQSVAWMCRQKVSI